MTETNLIAIDQRSGVPFYRQIVDQVMVAISTGQLRPGAQLPTIRRLAIDTQVNPNTVARAYRELEIRGIVKTQRGTGTFIAAKPGVARNEALHRVRLEKYCDAIIAEAAKMGIPLNELVTALRDRLSGRR